mgnify:CR=1 FL=1
MSTPLTAVIESMAGRGLTDTTAGVILGAYLRDPATVDQATKETMLTSIMVMFLKREAEQSKQLLEVVELLQMSEQQAASAVERARAFLEGNNNG